MSEAKTGAAVKKLVHIERIPVRWGDMDAMGHVNNTVYFRFMEQTRISWFEKLLPRGEAWGTTGIVIANASCNFKKAINYPATVEVKMYAGAAGGSSLPTTYELTVENQIHADGAATVVFIDMEKQKAVRIPENLRNLISKGIQ
jgi:acyl-CoA thioester hydrolase